MPIVMVEGPALPDLDRKRQFAKTLTRAAAQAYGLPEHTIVVVMHENPLECISSGGQLICDLPRPEGRPD